MIRQLQGALLLAGLVALPAAHAVDGYWLSEEGQAQIEIRTCDETPQAKCGYIVWLDDPYDADGELQRDTENPDESLRDRELIGARIVWDMERDGDRDGRWSGGRIYDPESGDEFSARMGLGDDGDTLDLRGYVGIPAFGRTSTWTREEERRELSEPPN